MRMQRRSTGGAGWKAVETRRDDGDWAEKINLSVVCRLSLALPIEIFIFRNGVYSQGEDFHSVGWSPGCTEPPSIRQEGCGCPRSRHPARGVLQGHS